jgi:putative ABC transport system permease protein
MNQLQFLGAIEIGLIYGVVAIGVYLTFRVIDFPDLTVDGSFTLGAAVSAALITGGYNPWLSTMVAILAGGMAGAVTGYLNVRWHILGLLAGIISMTALYSINLRVMQKPNIAIMDEATIFNDYSTLVFTAILLIVIILLLTRFFNSDFGLAIRASGINPRVGRAYGINVGLMKIITLAISNATVALAGSLFTQSNGFADISMGTGTVIVGLASVIIAEAIFRPGKIYAALIVCIIGAIAYRIAVAFALNAQSVGLEPSDLNLITAALVAFTMMLSKSNKSSK